MRGLLMAGVVAMAAANLVALATRQTTHDTAGISNVATVHGILLRNYAGLAELVSDADVIALGRVVSSVDDPVAGVPFRRVTLHLNEVVKGDLQVGSVLPITNTGGALRHGPPKAGVARATAPEPEATFEGIPVMKQGEEFLVFVRRGIDRRGLPAYGVLGEYQGRFRIRDGVIRFTGPSDQRDRGEFTVLRYVDGRSIQDVVAEVRRIAR